MTMNKKRGGIDDEINDGKKSHGNEGWMRRIGGRKEEQEEQTEETK